jgi:hypothetical protein
MFITGVIKTIFLTIIIVMAFSISIREIINKKYIDFEKTAESIALSQNFKQYKNSNIYISKRENGSNESLEINYNFNGVFLKPAEIQILAKQKIEIFESAEFLRVKSKDLNFFMLLNTNIFSIKSLLNFNFLVTLGKWVLIILIIYGLISISVKKLNVSVTNVILILIISLFYVTQYVNSINKFSVLNIKSSIGRIDTQLYSNNSILAVENKSLNIDTVVNFEDRQLLYRDNNYILIDQVGGKNSFIHSNNNKLYANTTLHTSNESAPFKLEIGSPPQWNFNPQKFSYRVTQSRLMTLHSDGKVLSSMGFFYPVINPPLVFPRANEEFVNEFSYSIVAHTRLNSLNLIVNFIRVLIIILIITYAIRIKNEN